MIHFLAHVASETPRLARTVRIGLARPYTVPMRAKTSPVALFVSALISSDPESPGRGTGVNRIWLQNRKTPKL